MPIDDLIEDALRRQQGKERQPPPRLWPLGKGLVECHGKQLEYKDWGGIDHKVERAQCEACSTVYIKRDTGIVLYVQKQGQEHFECGFCGETIKAAKVAHPIWDSPFGMGGSGKCEYETVPYCSVCEEQPSSSGSFIRPE